MPARGRALRFERRHADDIGFHRLDTFIEHLPRRPVFLCEDGRRGQEP